MSEHKLVDMRLSKKERKRGNEVAFEQPTVPHGLSINLEDGPLKKLGIKKLPAIGDRMTVVGAGVVRSVNEHSSEHHASRNVSIELEKLSVRPAKVETAEDAVSEAIKSV